MEDKKERLKLEKITRLGVVGSVFLVALAIFYYLVIYIPQKENQKIEQQRLEIDQQKEDKESKRQSLSSCLNSADKSYHDNWNNECKALGKLSASCIKLLDMTFDEYVKENNIPDDKKLNALDEFYTKKDECSCRLLTDSANRIEGWQKEAKDECYRKYPQN